MNFGPYSSLATTFLTVVFLTMLVFSIVWQMREKRSGMLKQMLELPRSNFRRFFTQAPNNFDKLFCECLLNVINGIVPVNKQLLRNQDVSFEQLFSSETSLKKAKSFSQKSRTHSSVGIVVLYLVKSRILHAEQFVLIPKRAFI